MYLWMHYKIIKFDGARRKKLPGHLTSIKEDTYSIGLMGFENRKDWENVVKLQWQQVKHECKPVQIS